MYILRCLLLEDSSQALLLILGQVLIGGEAFAGHWFIGVIFESGHCRLIAHSNQLPIDVVAILVSRTDCFSCRLLWRGVEEMRGQCGGGGGGGSGRRRQWYRISAGLLSGGCWYCCLCCLQSCSWTECFVVMRPLGDNVQFKYIIYTQ